MAKREESDNQAEARRRIEEARAAVSTTLDLSSLDLTVLPPEIGSLTALQTLYLTGNQLTTLPREIGLLTALQRLYLYGNKLMTLPPEIGALTALWELNLNFNQLTTLPPATGSLTALRELNLSNNRLTTLPAQIGRLTALRTFHLRGNQLNQLPKEIASLTALRSLYLQGNQLTRLPPEIGSLLKLERLVIPNNALVELPESLTKLTNLRVLGLHGNQNLEIPRELLGPEFDYLKSADNYAIPREILDYYFSTRGDKGEPLGELRLIVVGRPKVGKTTLVKRLRGLPMDRNEAETHGIDILPLDLKRADLTLHARVWDFGGQHVLHAMHEFFLRSRCLYLLVVEQRSNDVERDLTYWLQLIRSYAGDAPVVVALNQSKGIPRSLAKAALERDYGPIVAWVATECEPEENVPGADATIEALRRALTNAAAAMPEPKKLFPRKWLAIKRWLEDMKEPYLEYAAYSRRCAELHEGDPQQQAALAAAMDDLGVAINYARDPRLRDTTVLRPNWLANGIYALLRANMLGPRPLAADGVLTEEVVGEILKVAGDSNVLKAAEYPPEKWTFLLRLMNLFQLSFPMDDEGKRYLVPTLLPADEPPDSGEPVGADVVKLRYAFDVVPGPLLGRLIVRLFPFIDRRKAWQRGARLRLGQAQARVWADLNETYVFATVAGGGNDGADLLQMICEALKEMFREYERLRVVEQWWHIDDFIPRATLERFGVLPPETDIADERPVEREASRED